MKVAINTQIGGFRLSHLAIMRLAELEGIIVYPYFEKFSQEKGKIYYEPIPKNYIEKSFDTIEYFLEQIDTSKMCTFLDRSLPEFYTNFLSIKRHDPLLIKVIEELESKASIPAGSIKIVEIPDDVKYYIHESDEGYESIHEIHRIWY